jgi:two-component system cell cycle response regulator
MTRILTVDDSRSQRTIIIKALTGYDFEFIEAEDGQQGLQRLEEGGIDIVVLDVTMPVMDGPTMLAKMREKGDQTPVILLTAESKTTLIGPMLQQGVTDYILKPFKPEQLRAKVLKTLGPLPDPTPVSAPVAASGGGPRIPAAGKPFLDVLLVDDMDNVGKKLRTMLPERISMSTALDGQSALGVCRERVFRTIIVDLEIPDVDSSALASQLKALQPSAAFVALLMRTAPNPGETAREGGFDGYLFKPFDAMQIEEFLGTYYENQDLVRLDGNVINILPSEKAKHAEDQYYNKLSKLVRDGIDTVAAACHEAVVLDIKPLPRGDRLARFLIAVAEGATEMGLDMRLVGSPEQSASMSSLVETAQMRLYSTVEEAQRAS